MEILISALMGELAARSMSFILSKYSNPPTQLAVEVGLERILLRGQVIVDEAAGRRITNHGMLRQLGVLRDAMHRGYYELDASRCRSYQEDDAADRAAAKPGNPKLLFLSGGGRRSRRTTSRRLEEVLDGLRAMIADTGEMVMFLTSYPRLCRQPYSMHLLLDRCMFGRQMEMQLVTNFLLRTQASSSGHDSFDVLPIVGAGRVGKSTLVAHVCEDERVRGHFSQVVFFRHGDYRGEDIATLTDICATRDGNDGRSLVVVDIAGDIDDDLWQTLSSLCRQRTTSGSKIIIASRSDKITKLGTTQPLTLQHLSHEAYWYFFKVTTFGSTDPKMHPKLAHLAMEIARTLNGNLVSANMNACVLRSNFSIAFWRKALNFLRGYIQDHVSKIGEHPYELLKEHRPTYLRRMGRSGEDVLVLDQYQQTCSSPEELPTITVADVMYWSVRPHGTFKALGWRSRMPPYHCYIYTCQIRELQARAAKRKHSQVSCQW